MENEMQFVIKYALFGATFEISFFLDKFIQTFSLWQTEDKYVWRRCFWWLSLQVSSILKIFSRIEHIIDRLTRYKVK